MFSYPIRTRTVQSAFAPEARLELAKELFNDSARLTAVCSKPTGASLEYVPVSLPSLPTKILSGTEGNRTLDCLLKREVLSHRVPVPSHPIQLSNT